MNIKFYTKINTYVFLNVTQINRFMKLEKLKITNYKERNASHNWLTMKRSGIDSPS